jgi:hypothetical protein
MKNLKARSHLAFAKTVDKNLTPPQFWEKYLLCRKGVINEVWKGVNNSRGLHIQVSPCAIGNDQYLTSGLRRKAFKFLSIYHYIKQLHPNLFDVTAQAAKIHGVQRYQRMLWS